MLKCEFASFQSETFAPSLGITGWNSIASLELWAVSRAQAGLNWDSPMGSPITAFMV